jgi:hypothetical protein
MNLKKIITLLLILLCISILNNVSDSVVGVKYATSMQRASHHLLLIMIGAVSYEAFLRIFPNFRKIK